LVLGHATKAPGRGRMVSMSDGLECGRIGGDLAVGVQESRTSEVASTVPAASSPSLMLESLTSNPVPSAGDDGSPSVPVQESSASESVLEVPVPGVNDHNVVSFYHGCPEYAEPPPAIFGVPDHVDRLCFAGCGYNAAPGYETCCQGCAVGEAHDESCGRILTNANDANLALQIQVQEWRHQQLRHQQQQARRTVREMQRARDNKMWDPLFGEIDVSPHNPKRTLQRLVFGFCPCLLVGCGSTGRRVWKRYLLSWSFVLGALQLATMCFSIALNDGLMPLEQNPMLGPHYHLFDEMGAKNAARIKYEGQYWRFFSPIMLHAGFLHLLGNLSVQLRTGAMLEAVFGHIEWLLIYVFSGGYGVLASCVWAPTSLGVGSSGGLCGLFSAWFAFILITWHQTSPVDIKLRNAQMVSVGMSVLVIAALSFLPMMDFAAHFGGLFMGAALAMAVFAGRLQHQRWRIATRICGMTLSVAGPGFTLWWFVTKTSPPETLLNVCRPPQC